MGDVKQIRRLQTQAAAAYNDEGTHLIIFGEHKDGGAYDLHPLVKTDGETTTLLLPSPNGPAYQVGLQFDADTAGRLGRALLGLERKAKGGGDAEDE